MGRGTAPSQRSFPGSNEAFMGMNAPPLKVKPIPAMQPVQPVQPIQPMRATPAGGPFTGGNRKTTTLVPGAPRLPTNPYADAAWRRTVYRPKIR